jgi:hypothetical protein
VPTDEEGVAIFQTVWPGWYHGRATHIHVRIHTGSVTLDHGVFLGGGNISHTGQFFFSDNLVTEVSKTIEPYKSRRKDLVPQMNGDDGQFVHDGGGEQVVDVSRQTDKFSGSITVGIDPTANRTIHGDHPGHGDRPPWGRHPHGRPVNWTLWALLGVAFILAVGYCVRLYITRRNARMGYTALQQEESDRLQAGERRTSYGAF